MRWVPRALGLAGYLVFAALVAGWFLLARPVALGGEATYLKVSGRSMEPGMHTGDLAILRDTDDYAVGDIVGLRVPPPQPGAGAFVIHRIVAVDEHGRFLTQGDNNPAVDPWRLHGIDIMGEVMVAIPRAGYVFDLVDDPAILAAIIGGLTVVLGMTTSLPFDRRRQPATENRSR